MRPSITKPRILAQHGPIIPIATADHQAYSLFTNHLYCRKSYKCNVNIAYAQFTVNVYLTFL